MGIAFKIYCGVVFVLGLFIATCVGLRLLGVFFYIGGWFYYVGYSDYYCLALDVISFRIVYVFVILR